MLRGGLLFYSGAHYAAAHRHVFLKHIKAQLHMLPTLLLHALGGNKIIAISHLSTLHFSILPSHIKAIHHFTLGCMGEFVTLLGHIRRQ